MVPSHGCSSRKLLVSILTEHGTCTCDQMHPAPLRAFIRWPLPVIQDSKKASLGRLEATLAHLRSQENVLEFVPPASHVLHRRPKSQLRRCGSFGFVGLPKGLAHIPRGLGCRHPGCTPAQWQRCGADPSTISGAQHLNIYVQTRKWKIRGNRTPKQNRHVFGQTDDSSFARGRCCGNVTW